MMSGAVVSEEEQQLNIKVFEVIDDLLTLEYSDLYEDE